MCTGGGPRLLTLFQSKSGPPPLHITHSEADIGAAGTRVELHCATIGSLGLVKAALAVLDAPQHLVSLTSSVAGGQCRCGVIRFFPVAQISQPPNFRQFPLASRLRRLH